MPSPKICTECGAELSPDTQGGLCPKCLLSLGFIEQLAPTEPSLELADSQSANASVQSQIGNRKSAMTKVRYFGDYELLEEVARGGMGIVYKARQVSLNRIVALKMIAAGQLASPAMVERFHTEAEAAANLDHPNIVPIYEIGEHEGQHYFSMRFIEGGSLAERIGGSRRREEADERPHQPGPPRYLGGYEPKDIARLLATVARAVHYAHQRGILHRDLKPGNILLDAKGEPHVTDFGLAKVLEQESDLTRTRAIMGTPSYMAPEQAAGQTKHLTTAADVYSLGSILYELLAGQPPFRGANAMETLLRVKDEEPVKPRSLNAQVDRDLETICLKCLEKDPKRRYGSAEALADELARWLAHEPILARPSTAWERTSKWARRKPALAAFAIMTCLAALALVGIIVGLDYNSKLQDEVRKTELARRSEAGQKLEAERAREKAERFHYFLRINYAQREWLVNNIANAEQLLDECPRELRQWEWSYLKRLCHADIVTIDGRSSIRTVAFSPNTNLLISISTNGRMKLWDSEIGLENVTCRVRAEGVASAAFSPDGTCLATGHFDGSVNLWEVTTGKRIWNTTNHNKWVSSIAFTTDGKRLASGGYDRTVKVCNAATGELQLSLRGHAQQINSVAFSPDSRYLVSGGGERFVEPGRAMADKPGELKIWDLMAGQEARTLGGHSSVILSVVFSPTRNLIATACGDSTVKLWNPLNGELLFSLRGHASEVFSVAFNPKGDRLASAGGDGTVKVWDTSSGQEVLAYRGHRSPVFSVAFDPEGQRLASGSEDKTVKLWDFTKAQQAQTLRGYVSGVVFTPDLKRFAWTSKGILHVWDRTLSREILSLQRNTWGKVVFAPDGNYIASCQDNVATLLEVATGRAVKNFEGHAEPVWGLTFSSDGARLATCSGNDGSGEIKIWEIRTGQELLTLKGHSDDVVDAAFSPDGGLLASASDGGEEGGEVKLWDLKTSQVIYTLKGHKLPLHQVAFSPDGKLLASASGLDQEGTGGEIKLWDVATGRERFTLGDSRCILSVAFNPDSTRLISASGGWQDKAPGEIKLWDLITAQEAFTLRGHSLPVYAVAISEDGKSIASASTDGTVKIWESDPRAATVEMLEKANRIYTEMIENEATPPGIRGKALLNRSEIFKQLNRPAEAQVDFLLAKNIPRRDRDAKLRQIDLSKHYNAQFTEGWHFPEGRGQNLADLPRGIQTFAAVPFDVRGIIQLSGKKAEMKFPEKVQGILIGQKYQVLHFLHATGWVVEDGTQIGSYLLQYADGQERALPIIYGEDLREWHGRSDPVSAITRGTLAWPSADHEETDHRIFQSSWTNPLPQLEIKSIDYISAMTDCFPFLIAITGEQLK